MVGFGTKTTEAILLQLTHRHESLSVVSLAMVDFATNTSEAVLLQLSTGMSQSP